MVTSALAPIAARTRRASSAAAPGQLSGGISGGNFHSHRDAS
jgi:hypothetical protein